MAETIAILNLGGSVLDRFDKKPESFLRRSSSLKPQSGNDAFKHYRAKSGHDSRFGKAMLRSRIKDLNSETELGQSEEDGSPIMVMTPRVDKRFSYDLRPNEVDMNRAYKRRFGGKAHYSDIDRESVLPAASSKDSSFVLRRYLKRATSMKSDRKDDFNTALPFMNEDENKEAIMNLDERLMENRADATLHRGRDPTKDADGSTERNSLESQRTHERRLKQLKNEKQKMYFKQLERAWDDLKKNGKRKGSIFPQFTETEEESEGTESRNTGVEGVNANASDEAQA